MPQHDSKQSPAPSAGRPPDPRQIITPDAFVVAPELLGRPLASPWRRGVAMAVDGICIAFLSNAPSILFALAAAVVMFRIASRSSQGGYLRRSLRFAYRSGGALILFVVVLVAWQALFNEDPEEQNVPLVSSSAMFAGIEGLVTAADAMRLRQADSEEEAATATRRMVSQLRELGVEEDEIEEILEGLASGAEPQVLRAVRAAEEELERSEPLESVRADSLAFAYAEAVASDDTLAAQTLSTGLMRSLAADTLAELSERIDRLEAREEELEDELAAETERGGIMAFLSTTAEDFGLGAGWAALYFTAFLVLWRGQTPGKRLCRIRVIRLNGAALTWWTSFGRFGGYAAGLATGLLGYFQVFWDRNRQAVHDKISETVVVKG